MTSRLQTLAQRSADRAAKRAKKAAVRKFARTPIGRLAGESRRSAQGAKRMSAKMRRLLDSKMGAAVSKDINRAGSIEQYVANKGAAVALDWMWTALGPAGVALRQLMGIKSQAAKTTEQLEAAVQLLKEFGFDIKRPAGKSKDRDVSKLLDELPEILEEAEEAATKPKDTRALPSPRSRRPDVRRAPPEVPEIVPATPRVRGPIPADQYMSAFVETRDSSNVYGFQYDYVQQILYITYKAPGPPVRFKNAKTKDGKPYRLRIRAQKRGAMYAYGGAKSPVPESVFQGLDRARSKGTFVWDNIRQRGTIYGHQYPYRLVQGYVQAGRQTYIPRKATQGGYRQRALVPRGGTWQDAQFSTLPERRFRAVPDRGTPNRGEPNRGRP